MHPALTALAHRPWPPPTRAWTWRQSWLELLFAHWPVPASSLQRFVPPALKIQEHEGTSWVGVVPFRMTGVMRRPLPDVPGISAFPELNVRLYVEYDGKPGVWFLSLDATNALAVWAARRFFHLPYFRARMALRREGDTVHYESRREGASFIGSYRPIAEPVLAEAGSLEHWLTERYCLYALAPDGSLFRNEVHHATWPLQRAEAEIRESTMLEFHGIDVSGPPPLLHYASRLDVVVWPGERCV
jgi:uncharacterized protein